jgi:serine/threonine-protein kinase
VPSVRSVNPEVPEYAAAIARKALFADRSRRFQTAAEFVKALEVLARRNGWPLGVEALKPLLGG